MRLFLARSVSQFQARERGGRRYIEGYAGIYYRGNPEEEFELFEGLVERFVPPAFKAAAAPGVDVVGLYNHDKNQVLGRRDAGTLELAEDSRGLHYRIELADTERERDLWEHVRRDDVAGSSLTFRPTAINWKIEERGGREIEIREVADLEIGDVGPVTFPAYAGTQAAASRSSRSRLDPDNPELDAVRREWMERVRRRRASELARVQAIRFLDSHRGRR